MASNILTDDETNLFEAISNGDINSIKLLVEKGVDVNCVDDCFGATPLMMACTDGNNVEIVKYLVQNGADVNKRCYGDTPLETAFQAGEWGIVVELTNIGANLEDIDYYKEEYNLTDEQVNLLEGLKSVNFKPCLK